MLFRSANGINIEMIATSEIKISCVMRLADADRAVRTLHETFELGGQNAGTPAADSP
mgnify:CR=1 FL=1